MWANPDKMLLRDKLAHSFAHRLIMAGINEHEALRLGYTFMYEVEKSGWRKS